MRPTTVFDLAHDACVGLFASYGVDLASIEDGELDGRTPCAVLRFSGDLGLGLMLLAASPEILARTADPSRPFPDWVGELANQNLGRLKTLLLERGVKITVPPPTIASRLSLSDGWDRSGRVFRSTHGWVWLRLELERAPSLDRDAPRDPGLLREGEVLLF